MALAGAISRAGEVLAAYRDPIDQLVTGAVVGGHELQGALPTSGREVAVSGGFWGKREITPVPQVLDVRAARTAATSAVEQSAIAATALREALSHGEPALRVAGTRPMLQSAIEALDELTVSAHGVLAATDGVAGARSVEVDMATGQAAARVRSALTRVDRTVPATVPTLDLTMSLLDAAGRREEAVTRAASDLRESSIASADEIGSVIRATGAVTSDARLTAANDVRELWRIHAPLSATLRSLTDSLGDAARMLGSAPAHDTTELYLRAREVHTYADEAARVGHVLYTGIGSVGLPASKQQLTSIAGSLRTIASLAGDVEQQVLAGSTTSASIAELMGTTPGLARSADDLDSVLGADVEHAATRLESLADEQAVGESARASALDLLARAREAANVEPGVASLERAAAPTGTAVGEFRSPSTSRQWLFELVNTRKFHPERVELLRMVLSALNGRPVDVPENLAMAGVVAEMDRRLGTVGTDELLARLDAGDLTASRAALEEAFGPRPT